MYDEVVQMSLWVRLFCLATGEIFVEAGLHDANFPIPDLLGSAWMAGLLPSGLRGGNARFACHA
jgi:hypothetical protein